MRGLNGVGNCWDGLLGLLRGSQVYMGLEIEEGG